MSTNQNAFYLFQVISQPKTQYVLKCLNFLQTLSAIDFNQLEKVFYKNYRYFNNALKNQENSKTLGKLSEILLGDFTNQFGISRMEKLH